jgi:hypothetical protein
MYSSSSSTGRPKPNPNPSPSPSPYPYPYPYPNPNHRYRDRPGPTLRQRPRLRDHAWTATMGPRTRAAQGAQNICPSIAGCGTTATSPAESYHRHKDGMTNRPPCAAYAAAVEWYIRLHRVYPPPPPNPTLDPRPNPCSNPNPSPNPNPNQVSRLPLLRPLLRRRNPAHHRRHCRRRASARTVTAILSDWTAKAVPGTRATLRTADFTTTTTS